MIHEGLAHRSQHDPLFAVRQPLHILIIQVANQDTRFGEAADLIRVSENVQNSRSARKALSFLAKSFIFL